MIQKALGIVLRIWQALKIGSFNCTMTFNIFILIVFRIKMIAYTYGRTL